MPIPKLKPRYEVEGTYEKKVMDAWDRMESEFRQGARKIYVASSWRNPIQPEIVALLREAGHQVYDFRNPAPDNTGFAWSQIDPDWLGWEPRRFADLLTSHPVAADGFSFDKGALDWCDTCVMVLPCGRSAHLEAGYACGQGKRVIFFLHPDKFEPELMYLLGTALVDNHADLLRAVGGERTPFETLPQLRSIHHPKGKDSIMSDIDTTGLPAIGEPVGGGFFAGTFLLEGRLHALIVAPKAEGETEAAWRTSEEDRWPARSLRDGLANSEGIDDDSHPAARFCRTLAIGGYDDWYLPSRHEAALLAETLMPGDGFVPEQTSAEAFQEGGPESFERRAYWTSTELESGYAWYQTFYYGYQYLNGKGWRCRVRAVRKYPL